MFFFRSAAASRLNQTVETIPGRRIHDDESVGAVVLDWDGDVAPIDQAQLVRVLLKHETCRDGWQGNSQGVRGRQLNAQRRRGRNAEQIRSAGIGCAEAGSRRANQNAVSSQRRHRAPETATKRWGGISENGE